MGREGMRWDGRVTHFHSSLLACHTSRSRLLMCALEMRLWAAGLELAVHLLLVLVWISMLLVNAARIDSTPSCSQTATAFALISSAPSMTAFVVLVPSTPPLRGTKCIASPIFQIIQQHATHRCGREPTPTARHRPPFKHRRRAVRAERSCLLTEEESEFEIPLQCLPPS